jgi:acyl-CoA thioesterase
VSHDAVQAMLSADRASQSLGIDVVEIGDGRAVLSMRVRADMVNGHDIAHGGYIFLLADSAFACACNSYGPVTVAAGAEISFVTAGRLDDLLVATAEARTRYGRNGIYDVTVHRDDPDGRTVIAEFRGRSREVAR